MHTSRFLPLFISSIMFIFIPLTAPSRKVATKLQTKSIIEKNTKNNSQIKTLSSSDPATKLRFDTIAPLITFTGYDKTSAAAKESFFVNNGCDEFIYGLKFEISYFTLDSMLLHRRTVEQGISLPPDERRKVEIPTWDSQHNFLYYLSNQGKKTATPYKVEIRLKSISIY